MKRLKHYAFDPVATINLPESCLWVRVLDFDPMCAKAMGSQAPTPTFLTNPQVGLWEPAAVQLDERDFDPVYAFGIYRARPNRPFKTLSLRGNIEVQYGDSSDGDPGPLLRSLVSHPFEVACDATTGITLFLPKNTKSLSMLFRGHGGDMTQIAVIPIFLKTAGDSSKAIKDSGFFSVWEPGSILNPQMVDGAGNWLSFVRPTLGALSTVGHLVDWAGSAPEVQVHLIDSVAPSDDNIYNIYYRPYAPVVGLSLACNTAGTFFSISGFVKCSY